MNVDGKYIPQGIEFTTEQYDNGGIEKIGKGELGERRDKFLRHFKSVQLGIDPNATWEEINKAISTIAQREAAKKLGLAANASWDEIKNEDKRRNE